MLRCNVAVAQDRIEDGHQVTIVRRISEHQWYEPSMKGERFSVRRTGITVPARIAPCLPYSFGRVNARIGTNRSSAGIRNMICASARYLASNSRHRFTNRPADNRGK